MKQNVILDIGMAFDVSTFQQLVDSSKYNILYIGESEFVQKLSQHVSSEKLNIINTKTYIHLKMRN